MTRPRLRLRARTGALVLGAALLAPVAPAVPAMATPSSPHAATRDTAAPRSTERATRVGLAAYGDTDASGAVHLSGWLRWSNGKGLARPQRLELWGRTGSRWAPVRTVTTDRHGDVDLRVRPAVHTTYQLRFAGSRDRALPAAAAPSRSHRLRVRAVARVTLRAPARVRPGATFVVTGRVVPAGPRRSVVLTGDGATFTVLTARADGSFSAHVRLRTTTRLAVRVPTTADLDGAASAPRTVRVA